MAQSRALGIIFGSAGANGAKVVRGLVPGSAAHVDGQLRAHFDEEGQPRAGGGGGALLTLHAIGNVEVQAMDFVTVMEHRATVPRQPGAMIY